MNFIFLIKTLQTNSQNRRNNENTKYPKLSEMSVQSKIDLRKQMWVGTFSFGMVGKDVSHKFASAMCKENYLLNIDKYNIYSM